MASISENEAINHPYQYNDLPGPKGAFEARQVDGGLYVRVDMPGVPPDGLKLRKYSDTRTVTFSGKAPPVWKDMDSSDRVYAGYVVLDRDPLEVDVTAELKKGCLRLFFPHADGSLHSLSSKKVNNTCNDVQVNCSESQEITVSSDSTLHDGLEYQEWVLNDDAPDKETRDMNKHFRYLYKEGRIPYQAPRPDQIKGVQGGNFAHINPFLLSGVEGFYEHKVVKGDLSGRNDCGVYTRVDMPGVGDHQYSCKAFRDGSGLFYEAEGQKECDQDDGGRKYLYAGMQRCSCCKCIRVKDEFKDGVLRVLFAKVRLRSSSKKAGSKA